MRKSGLHKQISSIFDGVAVPGNDAVSESTEVTEETTAPLTQETQQADPQSENPPQVSGLVKRMASGVSEEACEPAPVVQVGRPMPVSKPQITPKGRSKSTLLPQIKKAVFGTNASLDPRQKKTGILVGILSIVFAIVMFVSLGGVGKTQAVAANTNHSNQTNLVSVAKKTAQEWQRPEPLPQNLRNATAPGAVRSSETSQAIEPAETGGLVVKGIVFSANKPSAIINNQIYSEGQTVNGATISKITKESVEFEANEKRWSQFVQR